ncbi:hypothetical protein TNCV_4982421 [Trichonephila clavipes]|nr:hypothetical protein TNCV_4982421 [Trichonephila clavipes]
MPFPDLETNSRFSNSKIKVQPLKPQNRLLGVPECPVQTWREVENIVKSHNYIGKHGRKTIGGIVRELARSARVVSSFHTRTACDEQALYEHRVSGHLPHLPSSQRKWTGCCSVVWERYPTRRQLSHQMFAQVHANVAEHGSFTAAF